MLNRIKNYGGSVSGENRFRFRETQRDIGFQPSTTENLATLSEEQIERFNETGYLTRLPGLSSAEVGVLRQYLVWLI